MLPNSNYHLPLKKIISRVELHLKTNYCILDVLSLLCNSPVTLLFIKGNAPFHTGNEITRSQNQKLLGEVFYMVEKIWLTREAN